MSILQVSEADLIKGIEDGVAPLKAERDALAAQLEELRRHLGTLTPGGSHTCITCAAHCVALEDAATELTDLRIKLGFRDNELATQKHAREMWQSDCLEADARILKLEASLREACGLMVRFILEGDSTVEESVDAFLVCQTEYSGVTSNAFTAETISKPAVPAPNKLYMNCSKHAVDSASITFTTTVAAIPLVVCPVCEPEGEQG